MLFAMIMSANGLAGTILALLVVAMIVLCAYYLGQIRDHIRELLDIQRKVAEKLGAMTPKRKS